MRGIYICQVICRLNSKACGLGEAVIIGGPETDKIEYRIILRVVKTGIRN